VAVAVSLLVNAAILGWLFVRGGSVLVPGREAAGPPRAVELSPLSSAQWEANRRPSSGQAPARPSRPALALVPAPPPPPPRSAPGQVVDVAPSKNNTPPKDSRFVSEHDSTVEKETRSRHAAAGYQNTLPKPSQPNPSQPAPPPEQRQQARAEAAGGRAGSSAAGSPAAGKSAGQPSLPDHAGRQRLALRLDPRGDLQLRDPREPVRGNGSAFSPGQKPSGTSSPGREGGRGGEGQGEGDGKPAPAQLRPSASNYAELAGGPAPDKLDGVEEGEGTYLNTREWKYASYFNRIKQAVAMQWRPSESLALRDPTGERFAYKDRLTVVSVTLDAAGALKDLQVKSSSGVDFLDATALEAFRKAQPFVNPPRGLANDRGEIPFVFGFYLEVGSGALRVFRGMPQ
jgi:TonB family protein